MKTGLHDRLRATRRDRVAPDTGPMTGSISNQQPSTIRGEAHWAADVLIAHHAFRTVSNGHERITAEMTVM